MKIESGFESGLDSKTGERLNSKLAWDPHKIQVGFQSSLKSRVPNMLFWCGTQWFCIWITEFGFESGVPNTHLSSSNQLEYVYACVHVCMLKDIERQESSQPTTILSSFLQARYVIFTMVLTWLCLLRGNTM
jgi:hypothetical protein